MMSGPDDLSRASLRVADACMMHALRRASRSVTAVYDRALAPAGLTAGQFTILTALGVGPVASLTELARRVGADRTTLSRLVGPLRARGLVGAGASRGSLALSDDGHRLLREALRLWESAQSTTRERIGCPDADVLRSLLQRL